MTDILLISLPPWTYEGPPLGIACLSSHLKSRGMRPQVLDANIEIYRGCTEAVKKLWDKKDNAFWSNKGFVESLEPILEKLVDNICCIDAEFLGLSVSSHTSLYFARELIIKLKQKKDSKKIVAGGPGCFFPDNRSLLRDMVDFFVIGKGEFILESLLKGKLTGKSEDNKSFKSWKDDQSGRAVCLQETNGLNLDHIAFPTFEEFDLPRYTNPSCLPIFASLGCIRACVFCLDCVLSGGYRTKSAQRVLEEIKFYVDRYNVRNFCFVDNLINGDVRYLEELCDLLINGNTPVNWEAQACVRSDMNKTLFYKMKKAGCVELRLGIESFSDKVLKVLNKGFTAEDAILNITSAKEAGLKVSIFLIIGTPGESEDDFKLTLDFIAKYVPKIDQVGNLNLLCIPPGTYLSNHLQAFNIQAAGQDSGEFDGFRWRTQDNLNNLDIRLGRYEKIKKLLQELDIPFNDNVEKMWA